jgi:hypothetical protein
VNFQIAKMPVFAQMVGHEIDFMTQVCQSLKPEVHADRRAPRLEKGFRSDHQNFHDRPNRLSVFFGFSLEDFADKIDPFFRRFMIGANHDFGQKAQCDELNPYDDKQNGEEK